jgi:hypothetical protein
MKNQNMNGSLTIQHQAVREADAVVLEIFGFRHTTVSLSTYFFQQNLVF